jgi:hypothetical protein
MPAPAPVAAAALDAVHHELHTLEEAMTAAALANIELRGWLRDLRTALWEAAPCGGGQWGWAQVDDACLALLFEDLDGDRRAIHADVGSAKLNQGGWR